MNELLKKSATEQSKALKNKEISAVELTNAAFERINSVEEKLGAFNSLTKETAIETAKISVFVASILITLITIFFLATQLVLHKYRKRRIK